MSMTDNPKLKGELTITRVFDAPRELVFKAWTDPKMMVKWWGPKFFTNPVCDVDARPGGSLYIVMRAPDGQEHPMKGEFQEVVPPERLVFTSVAIDAEGNHLLEGVARVTFEDVGGKTKMTLHTQVVGKVPQAEFMIGGMREGWTGSIDRLEELLKQG